MEDSLGPDEWLPPYPCPRSVISLQCTRAKPSDLAAQEHGKRMCVAQSLRESTHTSDGCRPTLVTAEIHVTKFSSLM